MNIALIISITIALILLGLVSIHRDKKEIYNEHQEISDFLGNLNSLVTKLCAGQVCDTEYYKFIKNSQKISNLMGESWANMPIQELESQIKCKSQPDPNKVLQVTINATQFNTSLEDQVKELNKQRRNPFILYYRGVGLILKIIFGYLIKLAFPKMSFRSKGWDIFSIIVSLLALITDLVGIVLQFKK